MLEVLVGRDGLARSVRLRQSFGGELLDTAAQQAVTGWRFHPAHHNGQPVATWVAIPLNFRFGAATPGQ